MEYQYSNSGLVGKVSWAYKLYQTAIDQDSHPTTRNMPLLNESYAYVLALTSLYLLFLYFGTIIMKNRNPVNLKTAMVLYNGGLAVLSLYMTVEIALAAMSADYGLGCIPITRAGVWARPEDVRMAKVMWLYFFSKAVELFDTVLMVLRKNTHQITFLHVFHHASMVNIWWWIGTFVPLANAYFGSMCNCAIHVVMYSYYGLSLFETMKPYLWWKRYLTQMQLVQFGVIFIYSSNVFFFCNGFPSWASGLLWWYMIIMSVLFGNFYRTSYRSRSSRSKKQK